MLAGLTHPNVVELSEELSQLTQGHLGHAFYASDGASAVEIALKMSHHFWRIHGRADKNEFICLSNGYHGETLGALSVTDVPLFKQAYAPLIQGVHVAQTPDFRKAPPGVGAQEWAQMAAQHLEHLLELNHSKVAAVILEPLVQCAGGMAMHHPYYLTRIRELCETYSVHLIADEIAVGCARTGTFFAFEQATPAIWPDFMCLSKGISGGYLPLSLVMTRDSIYKAFYDEKITKAFLHSHSYTGNPLACSAALATLDIFRDDQVLSANKILSSKISKGLMSLQNDKRVKHFRNQGMIWAFDAVVEDPAKRDTFSRRFFAKALEHELLVRPIGKTVYLMPPYILSDDEVGLLTQRLHVVFDEVMGFD